MWRDRYYNEAKKMYPFGEWFCDTNASLNEKITGLDPHITKSIYYHGVKYNSIWVRTFGLHVHVQYLKISMYMYKYYDDPEHL